MIGLACYTQTLKKLTYEAGGLSVEVMGEKLDRLCLDVVFTSSTVHELFMSCTSSNKRMTISSMEKSGHFCGLFIMK